MVKKLKSVGSVGLALSILFYLAILVLPMNVEAETIEGITYNVNSTFSGNLKFLIGKKVSVTIDSGKTFTGFIKDVGYHLVHLEKLEGKEYFDALIQIKNITAIDTRFRNM
jgi:hypothetical protein